mmetsp:Transcript_40040/g.114558  ORF Transcript_40040/g.114558 Transcript_40040/m.114558 type:complete len:230 (+) Transcript_40040:34-723(+)
MAGRLCRNTKSTAPLLPCAPVLLRRPRCRARTGGHSTGSALSVEFGMITLVRDKCPKLSQHAAVVLLQSCCILPAAIQSHPRVLEGALQRQPLIGVLVQQPADQVLSLARYVRRENRRARLDLVVCPLLAAVLEWWLAHQELIQEDTKTPNVHVVAILLAVDHLRRQIIQRAAKGRASGGGRMHSPTEVGDFQSVLQADQDVLRFDIAVHDVLGMAIHDRLNHLLEVPG